MPWQMVLIMECAFNCYIIWWMGRGVLWVGDGCMLHVHWQYVLQWDTQAFVLVGCCGMSSVWECALCERRKCGMLLVIICVRMILKEAQVSVRVHTVALPWTALTPQDVCSWSFFCCSCIENPKWHNVFGCFGNLPHLPGKRRLILHLNVRQNSGFRIQSDSGVIWFEHLLRGNVYRDKETQAL